METLFQCLVRDDPRGAGALVARHLAAGESADALCADLLGPAGHLLETRWAADACGLAELTLGMGHLLGLLRDLDHGDARGGTAWAGVERRVLLAAVPGERHAFGVSMLAAVFQRAGWDVVDVVMAESLNALAGRLADAAAGVTDENPAPVATPVPVIGLWAGALARLEALPTGLAALRRAVPGGAVRVILAGPALRGAPDGDERDRETGETAAQYGADAMADTAPAAVEQANRLLAAGGD